MKYLEKSNAGIRSMERFHWGSNGGEVLKPYCFREKIGATIRNIFKKLLVL